VSWATLVRADLVYFANGGSAQLPTKVEGNTVRLETPDGLIEFQRTDFRKMVPGFWPAHEWEGRREEALAGGAEARYKAAWWALENGLTKQAESMLREAHAADRAHQPTARLVSVLDQLAAPCSDPDLSSMRESLQAKMELARGPHVLLFHQHNEAEAAERINLVEQVLTTYYLMLSAQGIDLPAPTQRLASFWFAQQTDYLAYLRAEHADSFLTTNGYFHPTRNVVLAYDSRSSESQRTKRAALDVRRGELERARKQLPARGLMRLSVGGAPARTMNRAGAEEVLDRLNREVMRQQLLLDIDWRSVDLGTAAHETVHQLTALTSLAPDHQDFPQWLQEGYAAQFEVIRGGRWAGVGRAHDARLPDWRKIHPPPRIVPLVRDVGFGHGYHPDLYAEAWALVYYLRKEHPAEFLTFIDLLRAPDHDLSRSERTLTAFQAAFGPETTALESAWHRFMASLHTPLEAEDSAP